MKILNAQNLYSMKHDRFEFTGIWGDYFGNPPKNGAWIVYGKEKHGKTSFCLSLAKFLSNYERVLYISAEEGTDALFVDAVKRAGIPVSSKIGFLEYVTVEELGTVLKRRNAPKIVFIDNLTVYMDDFKRGGILRLLRKHPNILFVFIAHEARNEPSTGAGKTAKKLAKIIIHIEGLQADIKGRCPGGTLTIHDENAALYGIVETHNS